MGVVGQAVGQAQVVLDQHPSVGSIHVGRLDLGGAAVPVGPVQIAVARRAQESLHHRTRQIDGFSLRSRNIGAFFSKTNNNCIIFLVCWVRLKSCLGKVPFTSLNIETGSVIFSFF